MARSSRTCSPARPWRRIGEWVRRGRPRELCSRALAKGTRPLGFPSFWGGGGDGRKRPSPYLAGTPCLPDTSRRDDRPPTHFFVKKKFIPIGGAETATQKVPSVLCAGTWVRRRKSPARRRELFSLRKKRTAGIRLSLWQKAGSLYRLDPTPFPLLKITGSKGI